jgi:hypothetical protein
MYDTKEHRHTSNNYSENILILNNDVENHSVNPDESMTYQDLTQNSPECEIMEEHQSAEATGSSAVETPVCRKRRKISENTSQMDTVLLDISNTIKNLADRNKANKYDQFCQYLALELKDMRSEDADSFMENLNIQLITFKKNLRHRNNNN